jgi:hypothetical protein
MTASQADQLIDGYLARLRVAAADLPSSVRDELIDDMRAHIAEARAREPEETDATILNILDRLGEPAVVVGDASDRLGIRLSASYRPGVLEIAAVIGVPFLWPIGIILLWMSPAWKVRDKSHWNPTPTGRISRYDDVRSPRNGGGGWRGLHDRSRRGGQRNPERLPARRPASAASDRHSGASRRYLRAAVDHGGIPCTATALGSQPPSAGIGLAKFGRIVPQD